MAIENIVLASRGTSLGAARSDPSRAPEPPRLGTAGVNRRWAVAFAFGLVHGFGFSFGLQQTLQFAGSHLVSSLLAFNLGVELGQVAVLAIVLPLLHLLFRHVLAERLGVILLSAFVAHTACHWTMERGQAFGQFGWPVVGAADAVTLTRWAMAALFVGGVVWFVRRRRGRVPDRSSAL
jgi:HupE / UreJ protein